MSQTDAQPGPATSGLFRPVDAASLALFRILFGLLMAWEMTRYLYLGKVARQFVDRSYHFPYPGFEFLRPLPNPWMYAVVLALGAAAVFIALGCFYRWAAGLFCVGYTYLFLCDRTEYNNHFYLIALLGLLMTVARANACWSVDDAQPEATHRPSVPFWHLGLLQAQLAIVYVFGGIAKCNPDWLAGEPMRHWLPTRASWLGGEAAVYFFSYGGLLFDLLLPFALWWPRTRRVAVAAAVFFHLTNNWLFSIGIFPKLGIAALVLFAEPDAPRRWLARVRRVAAESVPLAPEPRSVGATAFVAVFLAVQVLVPLRHFAIPGDVAWTEEGHIFAWRMKLRSKRGVVQVLVTDPATGRTTRYPIEDDLDPRQVSKMSIRPYMVWVYARHVAARLRAAGVADPQVRARVIAELNFRPPQLQIDTAVDLLTVDYSVWRHNDWITHLEE